MSMADMGDIIIAFAPTISVAVGAVILWIKAELKKREETELKKEADTQGDVLATLGLMVADKAIQDARKFPELAPIIDELEEMFAIGVEIWNDPVGSNDEMVSLLEDAKGLYEKIKARVPA